MFKVHPIQTVLFTMFHVHQVFVFYFLSLKLTCIHSHETKYDLKARAQAHAHTYTPAAATIHSYMNYYKFKISFFFKYSGDLRRHDARSDAAAAACRPREEGST